jgi:hypothetical protein
MRSHIAGPTVSNHVNGLRPIRDDHLASYCAVIDRTEQAHLVAAWMRDTLPASTQSAILDPDGPTLTEDVTHWSPSLDPEQQGMIAWWTTKLATDRELDHIFRSITRKAGYTMSDEKNVSDQIREE